MPVRLAPRELPVEVWNTQIKRCGRPPCERSLISFGMTKQVAAKKTQPTGSSRFTTVVGFECECDCFGPGQSAMAYHFRDQHFRSRNRGCGDDCLAGSRRARRA